MTEVISTYTLLTPMTTRAQAMPPMTNAKPMSLKDTYEFPEARPYVPPKKEGGSK